MENKKIKELIKILEDSKLESLEIIEGDFEIKMCKPSAYATPVEAKAITKQETVENDNRVTIDSPLVGTFYSKPAPDASAFTSVGSNIEVGDVVCIIEAMKVMNEIKADKAGIIKEILVNDESVLEYGQPMFVIE